MSLLSFGPAILSARVLSYGVSQYVLGLIFCLPLLLPALASFLVTKMVRKFEKRLITMVFVSTIALAFLLIGPSKTLGFEKSIGLMCIGLAFLGFNAAFALIPIFPDVVDYAKEKWGDNPEILDKITGIYGTAFSMGHIAGPYLGAQLTESIGFESCTDILALACLVLSVIYFIIGSGYSACHLLKEDKSKTIQASIGTEHRSMKNDSEKSQDLID